MITFGKLVVAITLALVLSRIIMMFVVGEQHRLGQGMRKFVRWLNTPGGRTQSRETFANSSVKNSVAKMARAAKTAVKRASRAKSPQVMHRRARAAHRMARRVKHVARRAGAPRYAASMKKTAKTAATMAKASKSAIKATRRRPGQKRAAKVARAKVARRPARAKGAKGAYVRPELDRFVRPATGAGPLPPPEPLPTSMPGLDVPAPV